MDWCLNYFIKIEGRKRNDKTYYREFKLLSISMALVQGRMGARTKFNKNNWLYFIIC